MDGIGQGPDDVCVPLEAGLCTCCSSISNARQLGPCRHAGDTHSRFASHADWQEIRAKGGDWWPVAQRQGATRLFARRKGLHPRTGGAPAALAGRRQPGHRPPSWTARATRPVAGCRTGPPAGLLHPRRCPTILPVRLLRCHPCGIRARLSLSVRTASGTPAPRQPSPRTLSPTCVGKTAAGGAALQRLL